MEIEVAYAYNTQSYQIKQYWICYAIALNSTGSSMITTSNNCIKLWSLQNNGLMKPLAKLREHHSSIFCLFYCKQSNQFISGGSDGMRIWKKIDEWKCIQSEVLEEVYDITMNKQETVLFSTGLDHLIRIWKKKNNQIRWECLQILINNNAIGYQLCVNEKGNILASSYGQRIISVFQNRGQKWRRMQTIQNQNYGICFLDNETLLCNASYPGSIEIFVLNKNSKLFIKKSEFSYTPNCTYNSYSPLIYRKQNNILILKNYESIYVIKILNTQFYILHVINFQTTVIQFCLSENGQSLIVWDDDSKEFQFRQLK